MTGLKNSLLKVGKFLRLIDCNNVLSLTNIAFWLILFKIAITKDTSSLDIAALFATVANYSYKRYVDSKTPSKEDVLASYDQKFNSYDSQLKEVKDKIGEVAFAAGFRKGLKNERPK